MPTNRHLVKRTAKARITPELLETYTRARQVNQIYIACLRDQIPCRSSIPNHHCLECAESIRLSSQLRDLIKPKNWDFTGIGADQAEPPTYACTPALRRAWRQAWKLQMQLHALAEHADS